MSQPEPTHLPLPQAVRRRRQHLSPATLRAPDSGTDLRPENRNAAKSDAAAHTDPTETERQTDGQESRIRLERPTVQKSASWLTSIIFHLLLLIVLAILLTPIRKDEETPHVIQLAGAMLQQSQELSSSEEALSEQQITVLTQSEALAVEPTLFEPVASASLADFSGNGGQGDPTEQTGSFFGSVAFGNRFVYVLDMSGSMNSQRASRTRFDCAKAELIRSIYQLKEDQFFYVVLFSSGIRVQFDEAAGARQLVQATQANKARLAEWLASIPRARGGTDPRSALQLSLELDPEAIFLLSDGDFSSVFQRSRRNRQLGVMEIVTEQNKDQVPVHTIAYEDAASCARMEQVADATGGSYRFVSSLFDRAAHLKRRRNEREAQGLLRRAGTLLKQGKREAALRNYAKIVDRYPATASAEEARKQVKHLSPRPEEPSHRSATPVPTSN